MIEVHKFPYPFEDWKLACEKFARRTYGDRMDRVWSNPRLLEAAKQAATKGMAPETFVVKIFEN